MSNVIALSLVSLGNTTVRYLDKRNTRIDYQGRKFTMTRNKQRNTNESDSQISFMYVNKMHQNPIIEFEERLIYEIPKF